MFIYLILRKQGDEAKLKTPSGEIKMAKVEDVYAVIDQDGNYGIFHNEDGWAVTRLEGCWPLDSDLSGLYEHPEGIRLDEEQVEKLGIRKY